jgi:hypothetical protein
MCRIVVKMSHEESKVNDLIYIIRNDYAESALIVFPAELHFRR